MKIDTMQDENEDEHSNLVCDELEQMNFMSEEGTVKDHHTRDSHLIEFSQVLLEPQFQKLESEYHLSQKLLLVEKDPGSSMELIRHTNAMLKILNIGTLEDLEIIFGEQDKSKKGGTSMF